MDDPFEILAQFGQSLVPVELQIFHATGGSWLRYEWDKAEWIFPAPEKLAQIVSVRGKSLPYFQQLRAYEAGDFSNIISVEGGGTMALGRLSSGWTIAESNDTILFLDPKSDFSVWTFNAERWLVRKAASSLLEWASQAGKRYPRTRADHVDEDFLRCCVQSGLTDYIKYVLIPRGQLPKEDFLVEEGGRTMLNRQEGQLVERLAELTVELHQTDPLSQRSYREGLSHQIRLLGR